MTTAQVLKGRRSDEICQDLTDRRRNHNPRVGVRVRGGLIRSGGCSTLGVPLTVSTIPFSSRMTTATSGGRATNEVELAGLAAAPANASTRGGGRDSSWSRCRRPAVPGISGAGGRRVFDQLA